MTAPFFPGPRGRTPLETFQRYRDPVQQAKEMEVFLRLQKASMDALQDQLYGPQGTPGTVSVGPISLDPAVYGGQAQQQLSQQPGGQDAGFFQQLHQQAADPSYGLDSMSPDELISRANALGIADPEHIPTANLRQIIAQRRQDTRPMQDNGPGMGVAAGAAMLGLGAAKGVVDVLQQANNLANTATDFLGKIVGLPSQQEREQEIALAKQKLKGSPLAFAADIIDRDMGLNKVHNWLNGLDEGVRANMSPNEQLAGSIISGTGTFLPYAVGGEAAFKGIGAVLDAPVITSVLGRTAGSPLMRGMIQGAGTALILDSGTDKPWLPSMDELAKAMDPDSSTATRIGAGLNIAFGNRLMNATLGGAMGAMFEHLSSQFAARRAAAEQQGWDAGSQAYLHALDPANEVAVYTLGPDGQLIAIPSEAGAANRGFQLPAAPQLRQLGSGESSISTTVDGVPTPPETGGTPRLTGPMKQDPAELSQSYARSLAEIEGRLQQSPNDPALLAQRDQTIAALQRVKTNLDYYNPRTREDVIGPVVRLRSQIVDAQERLNQTILNGAPVEVWRPMEDQLNASVDQLHDHLFSAGIGRRNEPTLADYYKAGQVSAPTPSRDLVDQYGTVVRTPDGQPKMVFHGTHLPFESPDPAALAQSDNLFGPGMYFTDSPIVAGGDYNQQLSEPGYAGTRHGQIEGQRANIQIELQDAQAKMAAFEQMGPDSGIMPEVYAQLQQSTPVLEQQLAQLPQTAPNVRPAFLALKRVLNADVPMPREEGIRIIQYAADHPDSALGGFDFSKTATDWNQMFANGAQPTGTDFYNLMRFAEGSDPLAGEDPAQLGWTSTGSQPENWGKARTNQALQSAGYDAISYEGGKRFGTDSRIGTHTAYAVFDTKHVLSAYVSGEALEREAGALGINMAKQFEVMDSPLTPQLSARAKITDADVAAAMAANHPGGFHVIRGVNDIPAVMEGLRTQDFGDSYKGLIKAVRPVMHPDGRMDLLVSSLGEITDDVAQQYSQYGLFKGMDIVVKKSGKMGKVLEIYPDAVVWQSEAQARRGVKFKSRAKHGDLMPGSTDKQVIEAPQLYDRFKQYVLGETADRVHSAGDLEYTPNWLDDPQVMSRIAPLTDEFFDSVNITDPGVKAAMFRYFERERLGEIQNLDPALADYNAIIEQKIEDLNFVSNDTPDLHSVARQKGFELVTNPDGGFTLSDTSSPNKYQFGNEDAVRAFIDYAPVDRVPDATPSSGIPLEAAPQYPDNEAHVQPHEDTIEEQMLEDSVMEELEGDEPVDWEQLDNGATSDLGASGGGGGSGTPPNGPQTGNAGNGGGNSGGPPPNNNLPVPGDFEPYDPNRGPRREGLSRKQVLRRQLSGSGVDALQADYARKLLRRWISPARVFFAGLENDLHAAGVTDLTPWQDFDRITNGMDQGHNFTQPFLERVGAELAKVPRKALRDGSWMREWLIPDKVDRALHAVASGFKRPAVEALNNLDKIITEMHSDGGRAVEELKHFIAESRTNHETGSFGPSSYPDSYSNIRFFRDVAADKRIRFEKIDARSLFRNYIRQYGFNAYAGPAWNDAQNTWRTVQNLNVEGVRKYDKLASNVLDWMDFVQRGPEPGKDLAVRATNQVLKGLGVPLTHQETKQLMQSMQNKMYEALQGWRVHVVVRDSLQPLLSLPTVDAANLRQAYKTAVKLGSAEREQMKQLSYDMGVTQHKIPRLEGTGTFEAEGPNVDPQFSRSQLAIRAAGQAVGDVVRDAIPPAWRQADLLKFGPLAFYTAEGEWNRIIVGEAARLKFDQHWKDFTTTQRIAAVSGDPSLAPSPDAFIDQINATSFRPAITRRIRDLVANGQIDGPQGARGVYMRAVADRTQFTYGSRHAPLAVNTTAKRMGYALGNYATQYGAYAKEMLRYGSASHKFKAIATFAAVTGTLEYLHRKTGWNFRNFEWWQGLTFTGSPLMKSAAQTYQNVNALTEVVTSSHPRQDAVDQVSNLDIPQIAAEFVQGYNPTQGAFYTARGIDNALNSPSPATALARLFITGDTRGSATEYQNILGNINVDAQRQTTPVQHVPAAATPQPSRTRYPQVRLPGSNQFHAVEQSGNSLMQDMIDIQTKYQNRSPNNAGGYYNPPPSDSLGNGGGAQ